MGARQIDLEMIFHLKLEMFRDQLVRSHHNKQSQPQSQFPSQSSSWTFDKNIKPLALLQHEIVWKPLLEPHFRMQDSLWIVKNTLKC